jgi:hypothetical protein
MHPQAEDFAGVYQAQADSHGCRQRLASNAPMDTLMEIQDLAPDPTTPHINDGHPPPTSSDSNTMVMTPLEPSKAITPSSKESTRKLVVFDATNTVVEDILVNEDLVTVICKQLALVFENRAKRKMTVFIKVQLPVENKPKDPTSVACTKLMEFGEILIQGVAKKDKKLF